jgi:hypothetical protein
VNRAKIHAGVTFGDFLCSMTPMVGGAIRNHRFTWIGFKNSALIAAPVADSVFLGSGDPADDGRAAGDAGGAVLRRQP